MKQKGARHLRFIWMRYLIPAVVIASTLMGIYLLWMRHRSSPLDNFSKCLASRQVKMYGLYWCPHCEEQKALFGSAFQYVPYIECGIKGSRGEAELCVEQNVNHFPTWQLPGERYEGVLPLETLSQKSGCHLPESTPPK